MINVKLQLTGKVVVPDPMFAITKYTVLFDRVFLKTWMGSIIGIDPGQVNMGMAVMGPNGADLYQIGLTSETDPAQRMMNVVTVVDRLFPGDGAVAGACIEYAAHNKFHGQVPLAEARSAAGMALMTKGIVPLYPPPASIRKEVFGKGTIKAEEVWTNLADKKHNDFLAALSCALYFYEKGL